MTKDIYDERAEELLTQFPDNWSPSCLTIRDTIAAELRKMDAAREMASSVGHERIIALEKELAVLLTELETARMRLNACGVAALQNTTESRKERIARDNPFWCASYRDVCDAVDREIELRAENEKLKAEKLTEAERMTERDIKIIEKTFLLSSWPTTNKILLEAIRGSPKEKK